MPYLSQCVTQLVTFEGTSQLKVAGFSEDPSPAVAVAAKHYILAAMDCRILCRLHWGGTVANHNTTWHAFQVLTLRTANKQIVFELELQQYVVKRTCVGSITEGPLSA